MKILVCGVLFLLIGLITIPYDKLGSLNSASPTSPFALEVIKVIEKNKITYLRKYSDQKFEARFGDLHIYYVKSNNGWTTTRVEFDGESIDGLLSGKDKKLIIEVAMEKIKLYEIKRRKDALEKISEIANE